MDDRLTNEFLWQRIYELEKEIANLQRRLAGSETEYHKAAEQLSYYRGKYEELCYHRQKGGQGVG